MKPRILEITQGVLEKNDRLAQALRTRFKASEVYVINMVSSPGTGKTAFLEATLRMLIAEGHPAAALVGDLETENDAKRLARSGAAVRQILTGGNCHLEAEMIETNLQDWDLNELEYLFIENVGNLVCPASYDLGESLRLVLLSVTEGEDKPLKYPTVFNSAAAAIITKADLAEAVEFDREAALENIESVRPGMVVIETSAKKGQGMEQWLAYLKAQRQKQYPTAKAVVGVK
ncbi:hydrogenase nickel incorporation protein HypB [Candidatus Chlorohelix sp.]|uniref:hydrogenase nickel incorporation protein HypB n=1 Tax=Candidatus Chlorohelix sp. TaxID=3139201 RepID=UPI0030252C34